MSKAIRALVIEDSERDALLLVRRLERSGFDPAWERVETAESLRAALARQAWDIAFSDHSMRGFGSLDALRIVKEQGLDIPLVILSGAISEEEAVSAMQAGAVDYVRKDNLARLIPVVERELRAGQERRERQQAEAAQRESQARKSAMLDSALDCIVTIDHEGKVFEWNPAAEKTFGYRRGEVIGKELAALVIPPALRERHRQGLARYLSTGQSSILGKRMEMSALRADGTEFPVELSITQVPTEGLPLFTGFIRDITERRQAEETLHATEARLQAMLDNSPNVVFMKDTEGRYVEINRQFEKVFRINRSQIVGKTDDEVFPREQAAAFRANDALVLQAGIPMEFEEAALHADGRHTSIVSKFPLRDANGKIYALCGIATDITERRRLAEQLRQFQKMESIGQLAAGVAHDFNNILAVIQGHTDMVLGGMVAGNDAEESLKQVAAAAKRAANLTRQLLAFSRKQEMQPQDMDLNGVIKDMTRMLER